ncbi:hypothetical protein CAUPRSCDRAFT_12089 [Caulochytrium protostelioides]|uniref:Uncharacterized protein n=1 Tax=Caulochytrium protostelioides TaxID=1555241 RepID=A0A4P9WVP7_9FUNG|nr:hypothetical protein CAUPRSCDRAFT_12089 [Caulochytrium protostelioides]
MLPCVRAALLPCGDAAMAAWCVVPGSPFYSLCTPLRHEQIFTKIPLENLLAGWPSEHSAPGNGNNGRAMGRGRRFIDGDIVYMTNSLTLAPYPPGCPQGDRCFIVVGYGAHQWLQEGWPHNAAQRPWAPRGRHSAYAATVRHRSVRAKRSPAYTDDPGTDVFTH